MAAVSLHLPTEITLFSTESYPACHPLLLSLWSLQKMSGKKSLGAVSQFPLITWRRQLITSSRARARGHCSQALPIEKTFPWDCLGRSLPQLRCWRTACAGKRELKVGKQLVSTTTMYVDEALRATVIRNRWKATWGLKEKRALKEWGRYSAELKHFCFSRLFWFHVIVTDPLCNSFLVLKTVFKLIKYVFPCFAMKIPSVIMSKRLLLLCPWTCLMLRPGSNLCTWWNWAKKSKCTTVASLQFWMN